MPLLHPDHLTETCRNLFEAAQVPPSEAAAVAGRLVEANRLGHDSHGVIRMPQYLKGIEDGEVVPGAAVETAAETPASATLDGNWGFGQVVAGRAAEVCIAKARQCGLAAVTVRRSYHIGRLGAYVEEMARQEQIGLLMANAHGRGAIIAPWGGAEGRLATNPVAVGIPTGDPQAPAVLDMTTSAVAEGKVRVKLNSGEPVPDGWMLDGNGKPTNDPADLYTEPRGTILPFGGSAGHKGYGLGVIVDLLGGALSGAGTTGHPRARLGNGCFLLALDVGQFLPFGDFAAEVDGFVRYLKSTPPMAGFEEVLIPGEVERRQSARRGGEIAVDEETWRQIAACAEKLGVGIEPGT